MSEESVVVVVRVRPLNERESNAETTLRINQKETTITLRTTKSFSYDRVFGPQCAQTDLYRHVAAPIVAKTLRGYNGTVFAYGQTGTGKTFTMIGNGGARGIVPNACSHVFSAIADAGGGKSYAVTVTYLEIYNEDVRDLLSDTPRRKLVVREHPDLGIYVKDLKGFTVESVDAMMELLRRGNRNRLTSCTSMNDTSSRSHAIFTVLVESRTSDETRTGKLNFVDLAGSERPAKTQATGDRLKEAGSINRSLFVLSNVISALVSGRGVHVPFRNSKLTRLLQDSLGGNSRTAMIATVSPADGDHDETLCTLRCASRVKYITNTVTVNVEKKSGLIETFEREIEKLRRHLAALSDGEMERIAAEKLELEKKISAIQRKILVGVETAKLQELQLERSKGQLDEVREHEKRLELELVSKVGEIASFAEQRSTLEEENDDLTARLTEVQSAMAQLKAERTVQQREQQEEMQGLLGEYRRNVRELRLASLVLENYVPRSSMEEIERRRGWSTATNDCCIMGVARLNRVYDLIGRELGKWKVFARALDISESELNDLENIKSTQERVRQMLAMHENRCDPRNWRNTLIEALIRARRNDLRRRVEEELNRFNITAPP